MTRQEFIDKAFIACLTSSTANENALKAEECYRIAEKFADERAKRCPFDDDEQADTLYPWEDAPKQANWATTSYDGSIEWWSEKPDFNEGCWGTMQQITKFFIQYGGTHTVHDWKNSLEKRPS